MERTVYLEETERAVRASVERLATVEERRQMLEQLGRFVGYLNDVQALPQLVRECSMFAQQTVYYCLLKNHQLERRVGAFDHEVRQSVECLLSKLLVEYGNTGTDRRG